MEQQSRLKRSFKRLRAWRLQSCLVALAAEGGMSEANVCTDAAKDWEDLRASHAILTGALAIRKPSRTFAYWKKFIRDFSFPYSAWNWAC